MNTYKVIDTKTGASAHVEALTEIEAAIKCGKTAADMDAGRVKVEYVGPGPRYKAIGNSWAVPCARWIAERIQKMEDKQ